LNKDFLILVKRTSNEVYLIVIFLNKKGGDFHMKQKKYFAILLAALFLIGAFLTGCQGTSPTSNTTEDNKDNEETNTEKVTVNFWTPQWGEQDQVWWEKNIKAYNESQDAVEVKLTIIPGAAWDEKIKAAQAAGTSPDVTTMNYNKIVFSADQGSILALDDYVDPAVWEDLYPNVNDFVSVGGKHYAYPMLLEPSSLLFYRKDWFEEAGLDPEKPPVTWDELIAAGKALKKDRVAGLTAAADAVELGWTHWGLQGMVGGSPINDDWSAATINTPEYKKLVEFWATLKKEGILPKQSLGAYPDIKHFAEGRAAMAFNGSWAIGALRNDWPDLMDKVGVAVLPTPDGNQEVPTASLGGWTLTVDGNSKNPKEAAEFITWLLAGDEEIMIDFFKNVTKFSKFAARKSVDEALASDPDAQNDPYRQMVAEKVVPYAVAEPIYAWEISIAYSNAVERVILKGEDVEKSLKQAEKEINDYIQKNNYAGTNPKK
jgi:multiple sugar transport system substrate-binding protein